MKPCVCCNVSTASVREKGELVSNSSIETFMSKILHLVQNFIWKSLMFVDSWKL